MHNITSRKPEEGHSYFMLKTQYNNRNQLFQHKEKLKSNNSVFTLKKKSILNKEFSLLLLKKHLTSFPLRLEMSL